jgi:hypothetical protein
MKLRAKRWIAAGLLLAAVPLQADPVVLGQVHDRLGRGLPGAQVELIPIHKGYEQGLLRLEGRNPTAVAKTETDALGRFRLAASAPGVFSVRATAAGRVPLAFEPLPLVEETELPPVLLLEDAGAPLVVRNATGRPAAGIWVFAESEEDVPLSGGWRIAPRVGRTSADGSIAIPRLAHETLRIRAYFGTGGEVTRDAFIKGDLRLDAATIRRALRVIDSQGRGVPEVLVRFGEASWPAGLTDSEGRLSLQTRGEEALRVRLTSADGRWAVANLPGGNGESTLPLADAPPQAGQVRRDATGQPLAGALVWTGADPGAFSLTGAEGAFRIPVPRGSSFWIEAHAPGLLPHRAMLHAQRTSSGRAPTLRLQRPGEIVGRVVDGSGAPIAGAWVSAGPPPRPDTADLPRREPLAGISTGADGSFLLGRLKPGELYSIQAARAGFLPPPADTIAPAFAGRPSAIVLVLVPNRPASGRVLDAQGLPVSGAEVRLSPAAPRTQEAPRRLPLPDAVSDERGRFTVPSIPALALDVEVIRKGHARGLIRNLKVPPEKGALDLGTIRLRQGAALSGIVLDGQGRPVAGAAVFQVEELRPPQELASRLRDEPPATTTGADGRFSLADRPRGLPAHLFVLARGFLPATVRGVRPPTASPLRIRLAAGARFAGRVLDPEGLPVTGAKAALDWRQTAPGREDLLVGRPVSKTATTGSDGRFELADMPQGKGRLAVSAAGFVTVEGIAVSLPQAPGQEQTVVLARGAILEGKVETTAGAPVAGARVIAGSTACLSDSDGVFRTEEVPTGPVLIEVSHAHYPRHQRRLDIEPGVNRIEVVFEAGTSARGRVVDDAGNPVPGATAILEPLRRGGGLSYQAATDAEGAFTLEPVTTGVYRLRASARGHVDATAPQPVKIGNEPVEGLEVALGSGGVISGQILGLAADEISRVIVRAEHEQGETRPAEVDAAGRYSLRSLRAGGWLVQASLLDGQRHARARVLLTPGAEESRDLRFGGSLTLSGRVLYDDQPVVDAVVSVRGHRLAVERSAATDHEGAFRLEDLDADTYWLGLSQPSEMLAHNETIELAADREVTLQLERETVAGTVRDAASEEPVAEAMVSLRHPAGADGPEFQISGGTDASGVFRLDRVPPGHYLMKAVHPGHVAAEREVDVAPGSDLLGLEVLLQPASGADLVVRRASGTIPALLHLRLLAPSGAVILSETRPVGSSGKVRLPSAPAGSWTLLASGTGTALGAVPLTVPGEPAELVLPDAARLTVRIPTLATSDAIGSVALFGAEGRVFQNLGVGGSLEQSWPLVAGRVTVEGVPAGSWVVSATAPDGRTWSQAVATNGRTDLQVDLE